MHNNGAKPVWSESVVAGVIGGLVAALAMNQFQAAVSAVSESVSRIDQQRGQAGDSGQEPQSSGDDATVQAANAISRSAFQHELSSAEKKWAGPAVHYGMGAKVGALYGALAPSTQVETGAGTVYGAAVWLAADEIAVPLAGLSKLPTETPLSSHINALASHLVFGLALHFTRKIVLS